MASGGVCSQDPVTLLASPNLSFFPSWLRLPSQSCASLLVKDSEWAWEWGLLWLCLL